MKLINLTRHDGNAICVNAEKIEYMIPYYHYTTVSINGTMFDVMEPIENIREIIQGEREI